MNEQMMMICMAATAFFVILIGLAVVIQTILQVKMLKELRRISRDKSI